MSNNLNERSLITSNDNNSYHIQTQVQAQAQVQVEPNINQPAKMDRQLPFTQSIQSPPVIKSIHQLQQLQQPQQPDYELSIKYNRSIGEYLYNSTPFAKGPRSMLYYAINKYNKNMQVVIKRVLLNDKKNGEKYIRREIEVHKLLNGHPNIIKLYDVIEDYTPPPLGECRSIYLVLEYCRVGDMYKFQAGRPFSEAQVQLYMRQLVSALKYCYDNNVVHRDLKPHNILLFSQTTLKLSDFGLSKIEDSNYSSAQQAQQAQQGKIDMSSTLCGSPLYMSPELLHYRKYDNRSDIWSLGIIMYEFITGTPPYHVKSFNSLLNKVINPIELPKQFKNRISVLCYEFLMKLLEKNPDSRIGWVDIFNHPWLCDDNNLMLQRENMLISQAELLISPTQTPAHFYSNSPAIINPNKPDNQINKSDKPDNPEETLLDNIADNNIENKTVDSNISVSSSSDSRSSDSDYSDSESDSSSESSEELFLSINSDDMVDITNEIGKKSNNDKYNSNGNNSNNSNKLHKIDIKETKIITELKSTKYSKNLLDSGDFDSISCNDNGNSIDIINSKNISDYVVILNTPPRSNKSASQPININMPNSSSSTSTSTYKPFNRRFNNTPTSTNDISVTSPRVPLLQSVLSTPLQILRESFDYLSNNKKSV
jgi:serine/threonine protein kinase